MTLFAPATQDNEDFVELLAGVLRGEEDPLTWSGLS